MTGTMSAMQTARPQPCSIVRCRRGTVTIEFALVLPILLGLLIQIIDFGLAFHERIQLESAARAGLSFALADRTDTASIQDAVRQATGLPAGSLTVTVAEFCECPNGGGSVACGSGCGATPEAVYIQIDVQKTFDPLMPHRLLDEFYTLTGTAIGRVN